MRKNSVGQRGSVLVIVMVTVIFAVFALIVFMDKASNDLLVEQRDAEGRRLRREAYSALEVTLAVLQEFRAVSGGGLRSPAEGWGDPLTFAGYTPTDDRKVEVRFEDESGKISLPRANVIVLTNLFRSWEIPQHEAEALTDALLGWMQNSHVYTTGLVPTYEQASIPYLVPGRSLRSYQELAAIDKVRETFYGEDGRPNPLWQRFVDAVSLLDFQRPNINGAKPDTLAAVGQFDQMGQQNIADYLGGRGTYQGQGPGFFQNTNEALRISSSTTADLSGFAPTISALRIFITVIDGRSQFRLAVVVTTGGANTVTATATSTRMQASAANAQTTAAQQAQRARQQQQQQQQQATTGARQGASANPNQQNLRYPFTLLEIRENDEIPPVPPPPEPTF